MKRIYMNNKNKLAKLICVTSIKCLVIVCVVYIPSAYAYVDPGSGSVIVTTILGLIGAIGYTFRKYFYKVKRIFVKDNTKKKDQNSTDSDDG